MLTSLGKYLRMFRIQRNELLKDMADKLTVTSAYLSSVENGKREPTRKLVETIIQKYNLQGKDMQEFYAAYYDTVNEVTVNIDKASDSKKMLGIAFARKFDSLDQKQIDNIFKILDRGKN